MKVDVRETRWENANWIDVTEDRDRWPADVTKVINLRGPKNAAIFMTSWGTISSSKRILYRGVIYRRKPS